MFCNLYFPAAAPSKQKNAAHLENNIKIKIG